MVYIIRTCRDFLEKPYDALSNPIHICWWDCIPGSAVDDFSITVGVGFAKSLAIKLLLLGCVESGLSDPEMTAILPQIKALFSVRCVYRAAKDKKADRFQVLQDKFAESSRPRPDPLQVASLLAAQCHEEGGTWESHASQLIQEFQQGSANENKVLSDLEVQIVKMVPQLEDSTREVLAYHWSNYQAKQSGLPYKLLGCDPMVKGLKPRTDESSSSLWTTILGLSSQGQLKRHFFITRKIRYFCMKIAEAKRLRKKINLVP